MNSTEFWNLFILSNAAEVSVVKMVVRSLKAAQQTALYELGKPAAIAGSDGAGSSRNESDARVMTDPVKIFLWASFYNVGA